ncbi:hypothetical protein LguiB_034326 [Lonicera macranthoides]
MFEALWRRCGLHFPNHSGIMDWNTSTFTGRLYFFELIFVVCYMEILVVLVF